MLIVMKAEASEEQVDHVIARLHEAGVEAHVSRGEFRTIIGAIGDEEVVVGLPLEALPGVERAVPVMKQYRLVSREFRPEPSRVNVGGATVGPDSLTLIASAGSPASLEESVAAAKAAATAEAGVFHFATIRHSSSVLQHTSPDEVAQAVAACREASGLPVITDVADPRDLTTLSEAADGLVIGEGSMQDFLLLREAGLQRKPLLLRRGPWNTVEELLMSAEYIAKGGNEGIILCEGGLRSFEPSTASTLDLAAVPGIHSLSHLPVVVAPSHGAGRAEVARVLAMAAVAAGADGLFLPVHSDPASAAAEEPGAMRVEDLPGLRTVLARIRLAAHDES